MKTTYTLLTLLTIASFSFAQRNPEKFNPAGYQNNSIQLDDYAFESLRNFVSSTIEAPLPANFVTPSYIAEASTLQEASNAVGSRYPEFFGREGSELLTAISANPDRFTSLISETKAIRAQFSASAE